MAPVVSLPTSETPRLPNMPTKQPARWADVEDCTPSTCFESTLPDLKQVWPPTPTPLDAICDYRLPCLLSQAFPSPPDMPAHCARDSDLPVQTNAGSFPVFTETFPVFPEILVPSANASMAFPMDGRQMLIHALDPWCCEAPNSSCVEAAGIYGTQWTSFAPHQLGDPSALSGPWPNVNEDIENNSQLEVQLSGQWPVLGEGVNKSTQLAAAQPLPSVIDASTGSPAPGSLLHSTGQCKPCAWFYKESGCQNAEACGYCHLCPPGELKSRKKDKVHALKTGALAPVKARGSLGLKLDSLIQE